MSPAERKADQKAAKKALKLQYEHAKEVIDTFNSLVACDAAVSTTEEEICQGCSKVLPRRDQHYVCFSCKHKFKSDLLRSPMTMGQSFAEITMVKILLSF